MKKEKEKEEKKNREDIEEEKKEEKKEEIVNAEINKDKKINNNINDIDNDNDKINDNDNVVNANQNNPKISTCIFCIEEFDENEITNPLLECNQHIHGNCFVNYIESELNSNKFPIQCPFCQKEERHEINYKTIHDILLLNDRDNLANKLEYMSLNRLSETNPDEVSFCPTPGCSYICYYDKNAFHLNCPLCKKSYCLQCKTEWHKDMTCQEYQKSMNMTEEDKQNEKKFDEYVKGNRCKQCPKCKRWVEKKSGCDHITCPCGTHFCYRCGELRDSLAPYSHICRINNNNNNNNLFNPFLIYQPRNTILNDNNYTNNPIVMISFLMIITKLILEIIMSLMILTYLIIIIEIIT
jgi:hypothetical protein